MSSITVTNLRPDLFLMPGTKADGSDSKVQPRRRIYDAETVRMAIIAAMQPNGMFSAYHVRGYATEWTVGWMSRVSAKESSKVHEVWINAVEVVTNTNVAGTYVRVAARTTKTTADQVFLERAAANPTSPFILATGDGWVAIPPLDGDAPFESRMRPIQRTLYADTIELTVPFPGHEGQELTEENSFKLLVPAQGDARFAEVIDIAELKRRGDLL